MEETMTTDAERAREIVHQSGMCMLGHNPELCHEPKDIDWVCTLCLVEPIAAALAAVRTEERERAARIVDTLIVPGADGVHTVTRDAIADAIRRQEG